MRKLTTEERAALLRSLEAAGDFTLLGNVFCSVPVEAVPLAALPALAEHCEETADTHPTPHVAQSYRNKGLEYRSAIQRRTEKTLP
jgi:hypothetical protein